MNYRWMPLLAVAAFAAVTQAAEMDHSMMGHGAMDHAGMQQHNGPVPTAALDRLPAMPPSGVAHEAGFDGKYAMESAPAFDDPATRCAQASRGLVMLDHAGWANCGGRPEGAAATMEIPAGPMARPHAMGH